MFNLGGISSVKRITLQLLAPGNSICVSGSVFQIPVCQTKRDWTSSTWNVTALRIAHFSKSNGQQQCNKNHAGSWWGSWRLWFNPSRNQSQAHHFNAICVLWKRFCCWVTSVVSSLVVVTAPHPAELPPVPLSEALWERSLSNPWAQGTWASPYALLAKSSDFSWF